MIQFEYDPQTAGVRVTVSFTHRDGPVCVPTGSFEKVDGRGKAPATLNNLKCVREMLDAAIKQREERREAKA
jgi:hypothetical protein